MSGENLSPRPKAARTAVLVIHGIGEQDPYETVDSFARGLVKYFRSRGQTKFKIAPERIRHKDWTEVAIHLEFEEPATRRGLRRLSLFEFYWAPYTEDKVNYRESLKWLIRTDLTPLRFLSANLQALLDARVGKNWKDVAAIFFREMMRAVLLFVPLFLLLVAGYVWLPKAGNLSGFLRTAAPLLRRAPQMPLVLFVVCLIMGIFLLLFATFSLRDRLRRHEQSIQKRAETAWLGMAMFFLLSFAGAATLIAYHYDSIREIFRALVLNWNALQVLTIALVALVLRRILVTYVGDVAVYVAADQKTKSFEARSAILKASTESLKRLLADNVRNFDQVLLAGHSLGSVIAYDTINKLVSETWAADERRESTPPGTLDRKTLEKLGGMITFGSPLDKIYYFFREQVDEKQAFRAQILSFLHSFRRGYSGREYGNYKFNYGDPDLAASEPNAFPELPGFRWLNVWSPMDPISGHLNFYRLPPSDQRSFWYFPPLLAHLSYWRDPDFYAFFADELL